MRIRRVPLVEENKRAFKFRILQIEIKLAKVSAGAERLVNDSARGERCHVALHARTFKLFAGTMKTRLKLVLIDCGLSSNHSLANHRHGCQRGVSKGFRIHRHLAPTKEF